MGGRARSWPRSARASIPRGAARERLHRLCCLCRLRRLWVSTGKRSWSTNRSNGKDGECAEQRRRRGKQEQALESDEGCNDEGSEQRRDGLGNSGGDVHDAEILAAAAGIRQYLGRERLVDREEASVTEPEKPGRDHRDPEIGNQGEQQSGDRLQRGGDEDEDLAPTKLVREPAQEQRGENDEHHVDEDQRGEIVLGVLVLQPELQEVQQHG